MRFSTIVSVRDIPPITGAGPALPSGRSCESMLPPVEDPEKIVVVGSDIRGSPIVGSSAFRPAHACCDDARLVAHFRFRLTKTQQMG